MTDVTVLGKLPLFSQNTKDIPILNGDDIVYSINKLTLSAQKHFIKPLVLDNIRADRQPEQLLCFRSLTPTRSIASIEGPLACLCSKITFKCLTLPFNYLNRYTVKVINTFFVYYYLGSC